MLFCHLSAFNYKIENNEKVRDEDYNFQSYLDINVDREKHFISSLEFIRKLDCNYDVIIIDEVFSLLQYLFSDTGQKSKTLPQADLKRHYTHYYQLYLLFFC